MKVKAKQIHLSEKAIETISIMAIKAGTDFKNYVQDHLEQLAIKNTTKKSK